MQKHYYILILLFINTSLSAQIFGKFISPTKKDTITDGELFMVYEINKSISVKPSSIDVYLDESENLKTLVKIKGNSVKLLFSEPIGKGSHTINIYFKDSADNYYEDALPITIRPPYSKESLTADKTKQAFRLNGNIETYSKMNRFSGDTILNLEPSQNHYLNLNGEGAYKGVIFPFKLFITNQENSMLQSQNKFLIGFKTRIIGALYGDINPIYNTLIVNGSQTRGLDTYLDLNHIRVEFLYGTLNRVVEGKLQKYDILTGLPPVNLKPDSTYYVTGTYKRNITAFNLIFKSPRGHSDIRFTFAKSSDDSSSIKYGGAVAQNAVMGFQSQSCSKGSVFKLNFGAAISITTNDIRQGVITKDSLKSKFGLEFDPAGYKNIIILNSTTTPLTLNNMPSLNYFIEGRYNKKKFNLNVKFQRVGSAFQSFANPFIIKDRRFISVDNRNVLFKNKVTLAFDFRYYRNNLDKLLSTTQFTSMYGGKMSFNPDQSLPRIYFSYRLTLRDNQTTGLNGINSNMQIHNIAVGLGKEFITGTFSHSVDINYCQVLNKTIKPTNESQSNRTINFMVSEKHSSGLFLSLSYLTNILAVDTARLSLNNGYTLQSGYNSKNNKFGIALNLGINKAKQFNSTGELSSNQVALNVLYSFAKNSRISCQGGLFNYNESNQSLYNYEQFWVTLQLGYSF